MAKRQARFPVPFDEALRRLADGDLIEVMFEVGDHTQVVKQPREHIIKVLEAAAKENFIEETGLMGQRSNFGLHVPARHPLLGYGWMFLATKPECRIPDNVILEREREEAEKQEGELIQKWINKTAPKPPVDAGTKPN